MIKESQNQEPVSNMTLYHEIQKVYNGPNAGFFMLPLPNTELRHYLD